MTQNHMKKVAALKYDKESSNAPIVIAKGKGNVAKQIIDTAREHGVHVQEDPSLIEILYKLDINQQIPSELYSVVAELLSFVYAADKHKKGE